MKEFLKFTLNPHKKEIIVLIILLILQTYFQIRIINDFSTALTSVKKENISMIMDIGTNMLIFTILAMICAVITSFIATNISANSAYSLRHTMFHIYMNAPEEEINKFPKTGLMTRTIRGVYSEQGFIILFLRQLLVIPFVVAGVFIGISLVDFNFSINFLVIIIIITVLTIFKLDYITKLYFKAKKTYGKINGTFAKKVTEVKNKITKSEATRETFEEACQDSYDKTLKYDLNIYCIAPSLFLVFNLLMVFLLGVMSFGYSIGYTDIDMYDSIIIIQYILYLINSLSAITLFIYKWPKAYASATRIEEVLDLQDTIPKYKPKKTDKKIDFKLIYHNLINTKSDKGIIKNNISKFMIVLSDYRSRFIISLILLTISTICLSYSPKLAGTTVNLFKTKTNFILNDEIVLNIILLFILVVAGTLLDLLADRIMVFVGEETTYDLRMQLYDKINESEKTNEESMGSILSRMNNDLMNVKDYITVHLTEMISQSLSVLIVSILMLTTNYELGLIYIASMIVYIVILYYYDHKTKDLFKKHQNRLGTLMEYIGSALDNLHAIKNNNEENEVENEFDEINVEARENYKFSRYNTGLIQPISNFITNLSNMTVYLFGTYLLINHQITLGALLSILIYGQLLRQPLKVLSSSLGTTETAFSSLVRIFEIISPKKDEKNDYSKN